MHDAHAELASVDQHRCQQVRVDLLLELVVEVFDQYEEA